MMKKPPRDTDSFADVLGGEVTTRTFNILMREGVQTIGQFLALKPEYVANLRNAGFKTGQEVSAWQQEIERKRRREPVIQKGDLETQTQYTIRLIQHQAWWQGHDVACDANEDECRDFHANPFEEA